MSEQDNDKKIIAFPDHEARSSLKKEKALAEKQAKKDQLERERKEKEWRAQYRAQQALAQSQKAVANANGGGKVPFMNLEKIPLFTRCVVVSFIAVQIIMSFALSDAQSLRAIYNFGFIPAVYTGGMPWTPFAMIAPVTSLFIHGGWMHIVFNVVMMLAMGIFFERTFGSKRTLAVFLGCGLCGDAVYFALSPFSSVPVIGASGAISGLFAFSFLMMQQRGMISGPAAQRGPLPFIMLWLVLIVGFGMLSPNTAWQAHLGGFLGGVRLFFLWKSGKIKL